MKLITERDLIRGVAKKWYKAYAPNGRGVAWGRLIHESSETIYRELEAIDKETATPEDVAKIIGNDSWTRIVCGECKEDVSAVIRCGAETDYESATACICRRCSMTMTALWESDSSWREK